MERGSVTAETAILLPALAALLVLSLWCISAVGAQLRCIDAARTGARALARGESAAAANAAVRTLAPPGAVINISRGSDLVIVGVHVKSQLPGWWGGRGPSVDIGSSAAAAMER